MGGRQIVCEVLDIKLIRNEVIKISIINPFGQFQDHLSY
jgi:hypothetical protein